MKRTSLFLSLLVFFLVFGCDHKEQIIEEQQTTKPEDTNSAEEKEEVDLGNYVSDYPHNLNVVYFVPSDMQPLPDYHKRVSGVMLHMEEYFAKEMELNGFGRQTFGLLKSEKDPSFVKVTVVKGKENRWYYPYEGGGSKAGSEIAVYFDQNPSEKASDHVIVFMPSIEGKHGWDAGGVPFYGMGRWCYALDYDYFDMKYWQDGTKEGNSLWIGGTIHELGHGLNLPHNQHRVDDGWTSMMSWGNHEYNGSPDKVHLTKASAAILNNCQVFSSDPTRVFYAQNGTHTVESLCVYADQTNLYLRMKFLQDIPVNAVIVYNDPKTSEGDADYNAVTWCSTNIINNDSIFLSMPLSGLNADYKSHPFELRIRFCHENGTFSYESFNYKFVNGKPDIDINSQDIAEKDKSFWAVLGFSSEESVGENSGSNGRVMHAIDNNETTFWHSQWLGGQPAYPHYFAIDMKKEETIKGFSFVQRKDKYNGRLKDITIQVSNDGNKWTSLGDFTLRDFSLKQIIEFPIPQTFRYFKVKAKSGHDDGGENVYFATLAEVGVF